jgi:hypothetical protein
MIQHEIWSITSMQLFLAFALANVPQDLLFGANEVSWSAGGCGWASLATSLAHASALLGPNIWQKASPQFMDSLVRLVVKLKHSLLFREQS